MLCSGSSWSSLHRTAWYNKFKGQENKNTVKVTQDRKKVMLIIQQIRIILGFCVCHGIRLQLCDFSWAKIPQNQELCSFKFSVPVRPCLDANNLSIPFFFEQDSFAVEYALQIHNTGTEHCLFLNLLWHLGILFLLVQRFLCGQVWHIYIWRQRQTPSHNETTETGSDELFLPWILVLLKVFAQISILLFF
jgi:hypothetical protein